MKRFIKHITADSLSFSTILAIGIILLCGVLPLSSAFSTPVIGWTKTYSSTESNGSNLAYANAESIVQADDSGYLLAGSIYIEKDSGNSTYAWLIKTDATGNLQWDKTFDGASDASIYAAVKTSDGGYALAGYKTNPISGNSDFWLIKTDTTGDLLWNKTYGESNSEKAYSLVQTSDGGYILGGSSTNSASGTFWLVKVDSLGNIQWNTTFGTAGSFSNIDSIIQTINGGYMLLANSGEFNSLGFNCNMSFINVSSSGTVQGTKTYYGSQGTSMIQTADGCFVLGSTPNLIFMGPTVSCIIKINSSGDLLWNTTFTRFSFVSIASVIKSEDGGYTELGESIIPQYNIWLQHDDSTGTAQWNTSYSGPRFDARGLLQASDGGYLIFGSYGSQYYLVKAVTSTSAVTPQPTSSGNASGKILPNTSDIPIPVTIQPENSLNPTMIPIHIGTPTPEVFETAAPIIILVIAALEAVAIVCLTLLLFLNRTKKVS